MSVLGDLRQKYEGFLWNIALKKVAKVVVAGFISFATAHGAKEAGVPLDEKVLTLSCLGVLEGLRNWLKVKTGWSWL